MKGASIMQHFENLTIEVKGNQVIITIKDFNKEFGLSSSGKSKTVASTRGNVQVEGTDGLIIGLNAYKKA